MGYLIWKRTGEKLPVTEETTFLQLAKECQEKYPWPILLASCEYRLYELHKHCPDKGEVEFLTAADPDGHRTYVRGAQMLFLYALREEFGSALKNAVLEHAMGDGFYFDLVCEEPVTIERLQRVEERMREAVEQDLPFVKAQLPTREVREKFQHAGMKDKDRLFHYRRGSATNIYRLGDYEDYYYGYMPPSTGVLTVFSVIPYEEGVMLVLPNASAPGSPGHCLVSKKLFMTQRQTNQWGMEMGLPTVGALNDAIAAGKTNQIILSQEAHQEHLIGQIAAQIAKEQRRIVMVAGPSSSGKTSFSHRLSIQLANCGLRAHPIALDNYFVDRAHTPRDENGEYDYECIEALDVELFNSQMKALLRGERVSLPTFDFLKGKPEYNGDELQITKNDVLVIEGIHGLNNAMSYEIDEADKFRIYISALTQLNIDEHNRIPTTDSRLLRRIIRDARTRGNTARETIARWPSVRRGEDSHIFPFQEQADVLFDSALIYELAVLKTYAEPLLFGIPTDCPEAPEAKRLLKFLEYFLGMSSEIVPRNSLLREFIGGSLFVN